MHILTAPHEEALPPNKISLFLGGSIENGAARDWQSQIIAFLGQQDYADRLILLNPRRANWNPDWPIDDPTHDGLRTQIFWELRYQQKADLLAYYFAENTIAPITLLELGAHLGRIPVIGIEKGYKRFANVAVTADYFGLRYSTTWDGFTARLSRRIRQKLKQKRTA